jgi:RNA polymerase sigma factor (sigma-70 family)
LDPPQGSVERPSQAADQLEKEAWIRLGIELLDPDDREVIVRRQWEDQSFKTIGRELGLSEEAAWARHKRAVHRLSKKVGELRRGQLLSLNTPPSA